MQINIHQVHVELHSGLKELIEKKVSKLNQFSDKIDHVDVYAKIENNTHQIKDKVIEIKLHIPKHECFASATAKTFEVCIDEALHSITNQLKKLKERY